ncbi:hypothetical protein ABE096_12800 [Robertmurraya massiliosenegalensis]
MNENQITIKRTDSVTSGNGFKVVKVEVSAPVEKLYAVCTPVNLK